MELKSCHIKGFGAYKNKEIQFNKLEEIIADNGSGKSTLADFIKYMLYDLPKKDDRLKYAPFDEGPFGGSLTLINDGKEYRIEKDFDYKSQSKDTEAIYINNTLTDIKGLGNYLFKIDLEGFARTIFITSKDLSISSTSSINLKLNSLVSKTPDNFDFDKVMQDLKNARKAYSTSAKTTSLLIKDKNSLRDLKDERNKLLNLNLSLSNSYDELNAKTRELNDLKKELRDSEEFNLKAKLFNDYKVKKEAIFKDEENVRVIKEKYPKMLKNAEIAEIENALDEYNKLNIKIDNRNIINDIEFNRLNNLFTKYPLAEEDISNIDSKIKKLEIKRNELNNLNQFIIKDEDKLRFEGFNVEAEIKEAENYLKEYDELNNKLIISNEVNSKAKSFNYNIIIIIISFLILALGVTLIILKEYIPGAILSIAGALVSLLVIFIRPKNKNESKRDNLLLKYRDVEHKLGLILARYRYPENDYRANLIHLKNDYENYKDLNLKNIEIDNNINALNDIISNLKREIEEFISEYLDSYNEYSEALRIINNRFNRYNNMLNDRLEIEKQNQANNEAFNNLKAKLDKVLREYNLKIEAGPSYFKEMKIDLEKINYIENNILNKKNELNEFIIKNNIDLNNNYEIIDLNSLNAEIDLKTNELIKLNEQIKNYENDLERLPYLEAECNNLEERIKEYEHKGMIYDATIEALEVAANSLNEKYIKPLKDRFIYYADLLNSIFKDNITFDKDFNLKLIRNGKLRDDYHLSQGEATIAMLCYRLALIDNMFVNKPFIILDDPFVNLDLNNLEKAKMLIKKLSEDVQIFYFSCIDTRKI